ncbi:hypothetical protein HPB52_014458 [Rhipicephalus sanguineus]|uniref:Uncharacterized protein n=1 Tax=Rhipicephalus sanguineus TaxID=34632 RepID=A0A9D4Q071_RHISA|nr:hypothetical protein HPB52_014458 [Rhipicephalus sanguineus]
MEVIVEGEDLPPEMFSEDLGWQAAVARCSSYKATVARSFETKMESFAPKAEGSAGERQNGDEVKRKVIKVARMPPLPKENAKVILRSGCTAMGRAIRKVSGIDEAKANSDVICPNLQQNIVVVITPDRQNASRRTRIKTIEVASKIHEVSAYEAAPHSTCKGVIRGITLSDGPVDLERDIVNARNPLALGAKRINNTGTVIVLFDGFKVPNFVRYGPVPNDVVCRGWGSSNTDDHHQCMPKYKLCGGPHITADKICRQRYQIPYVVRRRRWEKAAEASGSKDEGAPATQPDPDPGLGGAPVPGAEKERYGSRRGGRAPGIANTGASHHGPTESVKVQRKRDNERLAQLERENKEMRDTIARLMAEISEIRGGGGQQPVEIVRHSTQSTEMAVVEECERPAKKQDKASGRAR